MSQHTVQFYFDYGSPYSYIGSHLIEGVCDKAGAGLEWMPMVIGGVFKAVGHTPGFTVEHRRVYMEEDVADLCAYHGIPYKARTEFLFNPILSLRATLAVPQGPERARAVHALYKGAFAEDLDLGQPDVVIGLLNDAGLDGAAIAASTQDQAIKDQLKANTDEAVSLGIFGAPTCVVDGKKKFWGHDRFPLLEHYLHNA